MFESDFTFPHGYVVEEFGELPGTGTLKVPLIYFPAPRGRPERDGEWLKVKAKSGRTWVGVFAFGPGSLTAAISTPEPNTVCVISKGEGYLVNADSPELWEEVRACPILISVCYQNTNFWSFPISLDWLRTVAMDSFGEAHEFAGMI